MIFDFDGVVADSETVSNQSLADYLTALGHPTTLDEAMHMFMGKHYADTVLAVERYIGRPMPADYETTHRDRVRVPDAFRDVGPVAGVADVPRCAPKRSRSASRRHRRAAGSITASTSSVSGTTSATTCSAPPWWRTASQRPDIYLHAAGRNVG